MIIKPHSVPGIVSHRGHGASLSQAREDYELGLRDMIYTSVSHTPACLNGTPLISAFSHDAQNSVNVFQSTSIQRHLSSPMNEVERPALDSDPIVGILAAFYLIPNEYHADLFHDFRAAADSQDLRQLLDTISDWAATAEIYVHPTLAADLRDAIGGRKGVADWLTG